MDQDTIGAGSKWIPGDDYRLITSRVPIVCVDILPFTADWRHFGLIERDTPSGLGLSLIGGAVLIDEDLQVAVERHLRTTLRVTPIEPIKMVDVYQYFRDRRPGRLHDPRKNAVAITYFSRIEGIAEPRGEAHKFQIFPVTTFPPWEAFGFGQGPVVRDCLDAAISYLQSIDEDQTKRSMVR